MARVAANPQRPHSEQVGLIARRFHEEHERLFTQHRTHEPPRSWDEMPASYQRRVIGTFDSLLRRGVIAPGPVIGWEHQPPEEI